MTDLSMSARTGETALLDPAELPAAIAVARRMLATFSTVDHGDAAAVDLALTATRESLRILVRALDRTAEQQKYDAVCRSVDAHFPVVAAFLAAERGEGQ